MKKELIMVAAMAAGVALAEPGFKFGIATGEPYIGTNDVWSSSAVTLSAECAYSNYLNNTKTTWTYVSYMKVNVGKYLFKGVFDDYATIQIDGNHVIPKQVQECKAGYGQAIFPADGWHKVELRVANNGGGGGMANTVSNNGFGGLWYSTDDGETWNKFEDSGDGSLFRTDLPDGVSINPKFDFFGVCWRNNRFCMTEIGTVDGNISIPSEIAGTAIESVYLWGTNSKKLDIVHVELPNTVNLVEQNTFNGCSNLVSVTLHEGVTTIPNHAFRDCVKLESINLPEGITVIGNSAFYNCNSLTHINIPGSVTEIQDYAFSYNYALDDITFSEGLQYIGLSSFHQCASLREIILPSTLTSLGFYRWYDTRLSFDGCTSLQRVEFRGPPPTNIEHYNFNCQVIYPPQCGAEWIEKLGIAKFPGYLTTDKALPEILSAGMRANQPTVMDVVYRVVSSNATVKTRMLAFKDGVVSFANVLVPHTFADGTESNIGDAITPNENHRVSWHVSADWNIDLSKVSVQILAQTANPVQLELTTLPAIDGYPRMTFSWNAMTDKQIWNALLWYYACGDEELTLTNGALNWKGTRIALNASLSNAAKATEYVFKKMGYEILTGNDLTHVNNITGLNLAPNGVLQYAVKKFEQ